MHFIDKDVRIAMRVEILNRISDAMVREPEVVKADVDGLSVDAKRLPNALQHQRRLSCPPCALDADQATAPVNLLAQVAVEIRRYRRNEAS